MSDKQIYYIKNGKLSFADKLLFADLDIILYNKDKVCLIGKNGSGKSSLLKAIAGEYNLDTGEIFIATKATIGYLAQKYSYNPNHTIYEHIYDTKTSDGKGDQAELLNNKYQADIILSNLNLDGNLSLNNLSGGQLRRASLAKILIQQPSILLLDEPTNHLDIKAIEWLETYLKSYNGALICISHDRRFLTNVTNKLWWLDRTKLHKTNKGFAYFEQWQEEIMQLEEARLTKLGKKVEQENIWLQQGVTGRRKRNQKRLADLKSLRTKLRDDSSHLDNSSSKLKIHDFKDANQTKFILEADDVSFKHQNDASYLIKHFNIKIIKGEKIGLIGPNGCGKTTLVKILIGQENPVSGTIKLGKNLTISYFDQHKIDLQPNESIHENLCPGGGDQIALPDGSFLHIAAYLKNFMFDPKHLNAKVETLSGGEASRLMLAKILAKPGNFLILDEPTNDLDMDTLEMLQDILGEYKGTILIISHDRDFLDKLVDRTLIFDGKGKIINFYGGYEDYQQHYKNIEKSKNNATAISKAPAVETLVKSDKSAPNKLSYKYQRRLEILPKLIETQELMIASIANELSNVDLYNKDQNKFNQLTIDLETAQQKLQDFEHEWLAIELMQ